MEIKPYKRKKVANLNNFMFDYKMDKIVEHRNRTYVMPHLSPMKITIESSIAPDTKKDPLAMALTHMTFYQAIERNVQDLLKKMWKKMHK